MQYLLLIYEDETVESNRSDADRQQLFAEYKKFSEELAASGKMLGGDALKSVKTATTVRVKEGETVLTDGPFAETKEQLGGFYAIDVADLDEACAWAAKIPASKTGSIEVRPIMLY